MQLSSNLPHEQMINKWAAILNPLLAVKITQGLALENIKLFSGVPQTLNHGLGRMLVGWFVTDKNAGTEVFRTQPLNDKTITLQSSADVTINLWLY